MSEEGKAQQKNRLATVTHTAKGNERMIVYQLFPRIFTNTNVTPKPWGTLDENGSGKLNDISPKVLAELKKLGVNTLWLTGVIEHATKTDFTEYGIEIDNPDVVKGEAGSPYAIKDYYDIDPALAVDVNNRLEEFKRVVQRIHDAGMKVIIDFVPNHTARRYHSDKAPEGVKDLGAEDDTTFFFKQNNNYYYIPNQKFTPSLPESSGKQTYFEFPAKATGNDCFSAFCGEYDWYETAKLNYGVDYGDHSTHFNPTPDTWLKMYSILKYWASMGVDGFRCDMVFMVPVHFWNWVITRIKKDFPDLVFIGEIYDVAQYREFLNYGLFDYLYDKVNLYDTLKGIETSGYSAAKLTDCWKAVDGIGHRMLNFLENHDEVRFASPEFAGDSSRIVPHLVVSTMMSKGPVMIYYGQELGEPGADNEGFAGNNNRTTIFDYWSVDTLRRWYNEGKCNEQLLTAHEKWIRNLYAKVLNLCNRSAAIREGMFFDLMYANLQNPDFDPHSQYCWLRYTDEELLLILVNFCDEKRDVKINIPDLAFDMAAIEEGAYVTTDELWGNLHKVSVSKNTPLSLPVKAHDAVIIKLNKQNQ